MHMCTSKYFTLESVASSYILVEAVMKPFMYLCTFNLWSDTGATYEAMYSNFLGFKVSLSYFSSVD